MPRGAVEQRGEEFAAIEGVLHARRVDGRVVAVPRGGRAVAGRVAERDGAARELALSAG